MCRLKSRASGKAPPRGKSNLRRQLDAMETDDDADEDEGDSADDMDIDTRDPVSSRATPAYSEEGAPSAEPALICACMQNCGRCGVLALLG